LSTSTQQEKVGFTSRLLRRNLPLFIVSLLTGIGLVIYFGPSTGASADPTFVAVSKQMTVWGVILASFAFMYGFISILILHIRRLYLRKESRTRIWSSIVLLGGFIVVMALIPSNPAGVSGPAIAALTMFPLTYILDGIRFDWVFHPYMSFRMFRITSLESGLMLLSFSITCLRNLPLVTAIWPPIIPIGDWISYVPQNASMRAAVACTGISGVMLGLRAIIWREPGLIELEK
jgi:hypothetical protein